MSDTDKIICCWLVSTQKQDHTWTWIRHTLIRSRKFIKHCSNLIRWPLKAAQLGDSLADGGELFSEHFYQMFSTSLVYDPSCLREWRLGRLTFVEFYTLDIFECFKFSELNRLYFWKKFKRGPEVYLFYRNSVELETSHISLQCSISWW